MTDPQPPRRARRRPPSTLLLLLASLLSGCDPGPTEPEPVAETVAGYLEGIAFGNGVFVAVGRTVVRDGEGSIVPRSDSALIVRSTDGTMWSPVGPRLPGMLVDVGLGAGRWVAVGYAAEPHEEEPLVLVSDDGSSWQRVQEPGDLRWRSVAWGNDRFVALGSNPSTARTVIAVSEDGMTWEQRAETDLFDARVSFGEGRFVLWGEAGGVGVSADGVDWETRGVPSVNRVDALVHDGERWIGSGLFDCCFGELPDRIEYYDIDSGDGETWDSQERALREVLFDLDALHGSRVATTGEGLVVADGSGGGAWQAAEFIESEAALFHLACSDAVCVAAGDALAMSADLEAWQVRDVPH